jgi:signal transduction histidine kinase
VSDRGNRSATPLIDVRTCQRQAREPFDGAGHVTRDDPSLAIVADIGLHAITHDLKNQLAAIARWASLLQRRVEAGVDQAAILHGLATIRSFAESMDALLGALLQTGDGKIDHGQLPMAGDSPVDLWTLSQQVVNQHRALAERHEFTLVGPGSGQALGNWNARSIERILANLLSNAVKYSPSGGQIIITVNRDVHEVHVAIHDDGIGIPTPALPHVFEPFDRVRNGDQRHDARHIPGFGIGLFAAQALARQHDGRIDVTSTERQRSAFTLVLPARDVTRIFHENIR